MRNSVILLLTSLGSISFLYGQTLKPKDIIVSTNLPDDFSGRYNIGVEYFFKSKKVEELNPISLFVNAGKTSTTIQNQKIQGIDFVGAINLYGSPLLPEKWNEYGGLKLGYGNFKNETLSQSKKSYLIAITTGIQPIILKTIALNISSDIGYMKNGLASLSFFSEDNQIFYSGFTVNFNVGVGISF